MKHLYKNNIISFMNSNNFKTIFVCQLLITLYSFFAYGLVLNKEINLSYLDKYININSSIWFFSISYIFLLLFVQIYIIKKYTNNYILVSRFNNIKAFWKFIRNIILLVNSILYFVSQILLLIMLNFTINKFEIKVMDTYNITNITYSIFVFIKNYLLMLSISLLNFNLIRVFKEKIVIICNVLLFTYMSTSLLRIGTVKRINDMSFYLYDYIAGCKYSSFKLEIICFLIFNIIIIAISNILFFYSNKKLKGAI